MIYLLFVFFSLGSLGRVSFFNQEINVYLYEILYVFLIAYLALKHRVKPVKKYKKQMMPVYIFLTILTVTYLISMFRFTAYQNIVAFLYFARLAIYLKGIPYIAYFLTLRKKAYINAFRVYAIITAVFSILQYIFYPNLRNLQYLGWDPHQFRMFGAVFDVSYAAALYGLITIFLYFIDKKYKIIASIFAIFGLLTYDRGLYVSALATSATYLISLKKYLLIGVVVAALIVGLIVLPKPSGEGVNLLRSSTINSRIADYQSGLTLFLKSPVLGVGYDHIRYVKPAQTQESHAGAGFHSSFLVIAVASGILGLGAFVYMLWGLTKFGDVALYSIIFLSLFSVFDNILLHPFILFFEVFLLGYLLKRDPETSSG